MTQLKGFIIIFSSKLFMLFVHSCIRDIPNPPHVTPFSWHSTVAGEKKKKKKSGWSHHVSQRHVAVFDLHWRAVE